MGTTSHCECAISNSDYRDMLSMGEQDKKDARSNKVVEKMMEKKKGTVRSRYGGPCRRRDER